MKRVCEFYRAQMTERRFSRSPQSLILPGVFFSSSPFPLNTLLPSLIDVYGIFYDQTLRRRRLRVHLLRTEAEGTDLLFLFGTSRDGVRVFSPRFYDRTFFFSFGPRAEDVLNCRGAAVRLPVGNAVFSPPGPYHKYVRGHTTRAESRRGE